MKLGYNIYNIHSLKKMVGNTTNLNEDGVEKNTKKLSKEELKSQLIYDYLKPKLKSRDASKFLNGAVEKLEVPEVMKTELKTRYLKLDTYSSLTE
jgi:hypothetical protein